MNALKQVRADVDDALRAFVDRQREHFANTDLTPLLAAARDLLAEGKRLRPAFCYWGWRGAGGAHNEALLRAAAALELLQASALVHDDVMDASDTRRGMPAAHRRFETIHARARWAGDAGQFGVGAAIVLGDLLLTWSDDMYQSSGLPLDALARGRRVYDVMRTELMCGQYLDLVEQSRAESTRESAYRVAVYKSAKYTVERPLHLGASLADAPAEVLAAYSAYGLKIGVAFQLRDDILGVFGDPAETGKPAGDDLREGKRTLLISAAISAASSAQVKVVRHLLGSQDLSSDGIASLRDIIRETGALAECEDVIKRHTDAALSALDRAPITKDARAALEDLAIAATARRT